MDTFIGSVQLNWWSIIVGERMVTGRVGQKGSSEKQSTTELKRYRDVLGNAPTMVKAQCATEASEIGGVKSFNFLIAAGAVVWDTQESKSGREMLCIIGNLETGMETSATDVIDFHKLCGSM